MAIGDPFVSSVPSVGTLGTAYAARVNDLLEEIVERLNVRVPVGSIAPADAALDMDNQSIQNARYLGFYEQASAPSGAPYGRLEYHGGEFYAVTPGGSVQITDQGALSVVSAGGIGGDYGSGPEAANFVASTETYEFYDDAAQAQWAVLKARRLDLVDEASGFVTTVTPSTSMAADQAYVLPPADPASGASVLVMTSTGQIALAENSQPTNVYTSVLPYHGNVEEVFAPASQYWTKTAGAGNPGVSSTTHVVTDATDVYTIRVDVPHVPVGRRLKGVSATVSNPTGSTCTVTVYPVTLGTVGASIGTANTTVVGNVTVSVSVTANTAAADKFYVMDVAFTGGAAVQTRAVLAITRTYDYVA